jgi:hypothetical protein
MRLISGADMQDTKIIDIARWREKLDTVGAGGGAAGLSLFASFVGLCCIGPMAVGVLGVSGAIALARWQPYRPYILGVSAFLLAWAFWRTYHLRRVCIA